MRATLQRALQTLAVTLPKGRSRPTADFARVTTFRMGHAARLPVLRTPRSGVTSEPILNKDLIRFARGRRPVRLAHPPAADVSGASECPCSRASPASSPADPVPSIVQAGARA